MQASAFDVALPALPASSASPHAAAGVADAVPVIPYVLGVEVVRRRLGQIRARLRTEVRNWA